MIANSEIDDDFSVESLDSAKERNAVRGLAEMSLVLICDDYEAIRQILRKACQTAGHETIEACDGKQAIALYESERPDLILLDVLMPEMDGIEVMETLRKIDPNIRVIAMSGAAMGDSYLELIQRMGAATCLTKPFQIKDMLAAVHEILALPVN